MDMVLTPRKWLTGLAIATVTGVAATGCGSNIPIASNGAATTTTDSLPAIVGGVPMAALARQALTEATIWSDPRPTHVRAVVSTQEGLESVLGYSYGATAPVFIVALEGRLVCSPSCGISAPALPGVTTTPTTTPVPISFMAFTFPLPRAHGSGGGSLSVTRIDPDLSKLGHVYDLQPYVNALG